MSKYEKMQIRDSYNNVWHTDLTHSIPTDFPYCCFALWCPPCASYMLRKRALHNDMSRYTCCAGYMPCSGSCGESKCPEFCLCTEVWCCFPNSTQHKVEMDKWDGKFGPVERPMQPPQFQMMSRIDQPVPPPVGYAPGYPPPQAYPPPPAYGQPAYGQPAYGQPYPAGYPPPQGGYAR